MLERPQVQQLWENANRAAHQLLLRVLDGGGDCRGDRGRRRRARPQGAARPSSRREAGIGGRVGGALPASAAQITILRSDQLDTAQDIANVLDGLPILLTGLSLALLGVTLLVAPGYRRETVRAYGFGLVAAGALALAAMGWAGDAVVDSLSRTAATEPVITAVWDIYDSLLVQAAGAAIFYGLVLVAGAWLAGPDRRGRRRPPHARAVPRASRRSPTARWRRSC